MTRHAHTRAIRARVPEALHNALEARADQLGQPVAVVIREAVAREVAKPVAPRARSFLASWLRAEEGAQS